MPAEFKEPAVQFIYPDNWELSREETTGWPRSVSVHSPTGAFWSVSVDTRDCDVMANDTMEAMRNEYDDCESAPLVRKLDDSSFRGFELHFYCLDLLVRAHLLAIPGGDQPKIVLYQAEIREFDPLQPVFDAISISLIRTPSRP